MIAFEIEWMHHLATQSAHESDYIDLQVLHVLSYRGGPSVTINSVEQCLLYIVMCLDNT